MLTVLIEAGDDAEALARTLASLVGGAVEGVVREVMVRGRENSDAFRVADHAGCVLVGGELAAVLSRAKGDWLLLLEPGARLAEGWTDAVRLHVVKSSAPARLSPDWGGRSPVLALLFPGRRTLGYGVLMPKKTALAKASEKATVASLAKGLKTVPLAARIRPASRK